MEERLAEVNMNDQQQELADDEKFLLGLCSESRGDVLVLASNPSANGKSQGEGCSSPKGQLPPFPRPL